MKTCPFDINAVPYKICSKCEAEKPLHEFYLKKPKAERHYSECKECMKKDGRERYSGKHKLAAERKKLFWAAYYERYPEKKKAKLKIT